MHRSNSSLNPLVEVQCTETGRQAKVALKDLKRFYIENPTYVEASKIEAPVAETQDTEEVGETDEGETDESDTGSKDPRTASTKHEDPE